MTGASVTLTMTHRDVRTVKKAGWAQPVMTPVFMELQMMRTRCVSVSRPVGTVQGVILSVQDMERVMETEVVTVHISLATLARIVKSQVCLGKFMFEFFL